MRIDPKVPVESSEDEPDVRVVREMERRLAKKEATSEWRPWFITVAVLTVVFGVVAVAIWLAPVFFMQGFK